MSRPGRPGTIAAVFVGGIASFVVAVNLVRAIRPALLTDPDPSWLVPRLVLQLLVLAAAVTAGGLAAAAFFLWSRDPRATAALKALPFRPAALVALASASIVLGIWLRFFALERIPESLWVDDLSLISPALGLGAGWSDFSDSIRPVPYGVRTPGGTVGVLYLELFRLSLEKLGTTVAGLRFPSAAAGALSVFTAFLLGRALLPRGGGTLAALVLAGLRWHLILSRWAWNAIVLVPFVDVATLLLLRARRRNGLGAACAAGLVAGLAAHIYLAAWVAGLALLAFALWPSSTAPARRDRAVLAGAFLGGFLVAVAPLFVLREGRKAPYFARAGVTNVLLDLRRHKPFFPSIAVLADSFVAPWLIPDPAARHDLPGQSRVGWILGIPIAACFVRSLVCPREELSGLVLLHSGAALVASFAWGPAGHPNGFRFGYLTTIAAVAASAGTLALVRVASPRYLRAAALSAVGLLSLSGVLGARDAILRWADSRETFDAFSGQDTLLGRAAARWDGYGVVSIEPRLGRSDLTIDVVRRYRLTPRSGRGEIGAPDAMAPPVRASRVFRLRGPREEPVGDERVVERVRDEWGRDWAIVTGRSRPPA